MIFFLRALLSIIIITSFVTGAFALKSDRAQLIYVSSNTAHLNLHTGVAIYTGHVEANQGTKQLTSHQVIINRNPAGQVDKMVAYGEPAYYSSLPELSQPMLYSHALIIRYLPPDDSITFTDQANVVQGKKVYSGPKITYDTQTQIINSPYSYIGRSSLLIPPKQNKKTAQPPRQNYVPDNNSLTPPTPQQLDIDHEQYFPSPYTTSS